MVQRVTTVAFEGIEARAVDVQVQVAPGLPAFNVVGLPDKAVSEARERVRAALVASGLALPARRITVNLAPADLPKEGSHYDLPIALGLMAAIGAIPSDAVSGFTVLGELGLDGSIAAVAGVLPAAIGANARAEGLICPAACGPEAAWASPDMEIIDRLGRRRDRGRRAYQPPAVSCPAPLGEHAGTGRRRLARATRRSLAGASWRSVPGRAAGIPGACAGFVAAAAGNRRGGNCACQPSRHLSRALHACCGDEPLPLRTRQRSRLYLQARAECPMRR